VLCVTDMKHVYCTYRHLVGGHAAVLFISRERASLIVHCTSAVRLVLVTTQRPQPCILIYGSGRDVLLLD